MARSISCGSKTLERSASRASEWNPTALARSARSIYESTTAKKQAINVGRARDLLGEVVKSLASTGEMLFLVSGEDKRDILARVLASEDLPRRPRAFRRRASLAH